MVAPKQIQSISQDTIEATKNNNFMSHRPTTSGESQTIEGMKRGPIVLTDQD